MPATPPAENPHELDPKSLTSSDAGLLQARANRAICKAFNNYLANYDLSLSDWSLLGLLKSGQPICHITIACELDVTPTMTTKIVNHLQAKNYIERHTCTNDSRVKYVTLTPSGRKVIREIEPRLFEHITELVEGITQEDLGAYVRVLAHIAQWDRETEE